MKKTFKKLLCIILIIMYLLPFFQSMSLAASVPINKANLHDDHTIITNVEFNDETGWAELECEYICHTVSGKKYPAYCISHGLDGVDERGDYTVDISSVLDDVKIWRTIINGYPYKTPSELGVNTADDAYAATKQAIYSVILNRNVKSFYRGINEKGQKVVNAIYNISEKGKKGTQTPQNANLKIVKVGTLVEEGEYYSQTYSVKADVDIGNYTITSIQGFTSGSFSADIEGNRKSNFSANQNFKMMIPKKEITNNLNGSVFVSAKCKTYPVLYGETRIANTQDYAVTFDPYRRF